MQSFLAKNGITPKNALRLDDEILSSDKKEKRK